MIIRFQWPQSQWPVQNASTRGTSADLLSVIGFVDSDEVHETFAMRDGDSVEENAGSGVGATAVFVDGLAGTLAGAPTGVPSSNVHSPSAGFIPGVADSNSGPPKAPVPNDIDAV